MPCASRSARRPEPRDDARLQSHRGPGLNQSLTERLAQAVSVLGLEPPLQTEQLLHHEMGAVYRVRGSGAAASCIALAADDALPPDFLRRVRHVLALQPWLEPSFAARPLRFFHRENVAILLLQDPGGRLLTTCLGEALDIDRFLRLALHMARAVEGLHAAGIVHRDIRPSNILVSEDEGAWLLGFGQSFRAGQASPPASFSVQRDEDLARMSPEQAGEIDQAVDARSDLYAFGVVLYEMLTGELPPVRREGADWIAANLARHRKRLGVHAGELPWQVADIIGKLLARSPEDRYQSAASVVADLQRCEHNWGASGAIQRFALNQHGAAGRFFATGHLYGRDAQVRTLIDAYAQVATHGGCGLALVSGASGVGKSSVVGALQSHVQSRNGRFAAGKFERHKSDIPYSTLAQAFRELLSVVLGADEASQSRWRATLGSALGPNASLLLNVAPSLELLLGTLQPPGELSPTEAAARFQLAVRSFLAEFASPGRPLALFIDDLQWADAATLELVHHVLSHEDTRGLLVVGAYRSDEVDASHPLQSMKAAVRGSGLAVTELVLEGLAVAEVGKLVADTLRVSQADAAPLASHVHASTRGNPFFTLQLLGALAEQELLHADGATQGWTWDLARIQANGKTQDVAELVTGKLRRLPGPVRDLLEVLSCFGSSTTIASLRAASGHGLRDLDQFLGIAEGAGLVAREGDTCQFRHDRIQEAAYALVSPAQRPHKHLRIGRRLAEAFDPAQLRVHLFDVANQLARGVELISDPGDRHRTAGLFREAARRARSETAYNAALRYLEGADDLLGDARWEQAYELAFSVALAQAECEFLLGLLEHAEQRLARLAQHARGMVDRGAVAWLQVTLYTAMDRSDAAIATCVAFLASADIHVSPHPSDEEARQEYEVLLRRIGSRGAVDALLELPLLTDPRQAAVLDVLAAALPPAFFSDPNLVCLLLCRMANLSCIHGNGDASALAYAYLGMVVGPRFDDYPTAYAFGKLGYDLVERGQLTRYRPRVHMTFAYHVTPWTRPLREGLSLLRGAFDLARESGDVTYAGFSSCTLVTVLLSSQVHLADVQREGRERLRYVTGAKFGLVADIMTVQLQLIATLRGETPVFGSFDDAQFSEAEFEARLVPNRNLAIAYCWYWIRKMHARYFAGRFEEAVEAAERAEPLLWTSSGHFETVQYHLIAALARAAACDGASAKRRAEHLEALRVHQAQLRTWAAHCSETFLFRADLVDAEIARVEGRTVEALQKYEQALQASRAGVPQNQAGTLELAAGFYLRLGLESVALPLLVQSRDQYALWGAEAKVRQLETLYPALRRAPRDAAASHGTPGQAADASDVTAVLRASQALGEVGLEQLMRSLMLIALEHAGADRVLLVLPRGERLCIEAEAAAQDGTLGVKVRSTPVTGADLPSSVLHYAMHTRATVLLDNARDSEHFARDPYIANGPCRSLLCLPLVKQGELVGVLYLENNAATHAFTPSRVAMLNLLASTAALSLQNALLEEKESLLKEVHHRVKNNLQLISSLLSLQAAQLPDPATAELFLESRNRVRSMALVHENLYRAGNFARISMPSHLESLCGQLVRAYGIDRRKIATVVDVDDVQLDLDRAVCCGLIVNELVSNALKHGFPDGRTGTITVRLSAGAGGACALSVRDDGIGLPGTVDVTSARTLGLQLVGDLTQQLRGRLEVGAGPGAGFLVAFATEDERIKT